MISRFTMPKVWILNTEETHSETTLRHPSPNVAKYIWNIEKDDICLAAFNVDPDLLEYIDTVKKLEHSTRIIKVERLSKPYFLVDSIIKDKKLLAFLKNLVKSGNWQLEPYIQTKRIVELSRLTNIAFRQTGNKLILHNLIDNLNCKAYFKTLCKQINLNTPQGLIFDDLDKLLIYLKNLKAKDFKHIILKKTKAAGGFGNLRGSKKTLINTLPIWLMPNEKVIIEDFIILDKTIGTLVEISAKNIKFIGVDQQISKDTIWQGLQYPLTNRKLFSAVKRKSLALAKIVQQKGARGWLNIDFGIRTSDKKLFGFEMNFRHNSFSLLINNFAKPKNYLIYYNGFKTKHKTAAKILNNLAKKSILAKNTTDKEGVILVNVNPKFNTYGLAIFSPTKNYIDKIARMLGVTQTLRL